MVGILLQVGIVYPRHLVALAQPASHLQGILAMLRHTQVQSLQAQVEQKRILRRLDRAQVAHQLAGGLGDIGHLPKGLRVGQAVVRGIRLAKAGELVGMGLPIEVAAIYDATAYAGRMAIHVFRRGMGDDVSAPLKRPTVNRRGKGVVHDQGNAVAVGDARELLNIQYHHTRIRDGLAKQQLRIGTERLADLLLAGILIDESALNA